MTEQEALHWIADIFQEPADRLTPDTPRERINTWDSMGVLVLMAGMDEQFNVVMSDEEMGGMHCIDDILAVLRKNNKITGAT